MWRGRFEFGEGWAAYRGATDQTSPHAHVALQLAWGGQDGVEVELEGATLRASALLIRPLVSHQVAAGQEQVTFLYVEPQARLGQALLRIGGDEAAVVLPESLAGLGELDLPSAVAGLERSLDVAARPALDARLARALHALVEDSGGSGRVARAATASGLSEPRLRRLAREQLGTPLARWTLWQKLSRAGRALAGGAPLAEAAAAGGFADQAHLTRTMRRMFGVTPRTASRALRSRTAEEGGPDSGA